MEWQTIESAPKDGTPVMVSTTHGDVIDIVWWKHGSWRAYAWGVISYQPTHWMKLPPPPANDNRKDG